MVKKQSSEILDLLDLDVQYGENEDWNWSVLAVGVLLDRKGLDDGSRFLRWEASSLFNFNFVKET